MLNSTINVHFNKLKDAQWNRLNLICIGNTPAIIFVKSIRMFPVGIFFLKKKKDLIKEQLAIGEKKKVTVED